MPAEVFAQPLTPTIDWLERQDRHSYDQVIDGTEELKDSKDLLERRLRDARDWQTLRGCP